MQLRKIFIIILGNILFLKEGGATRLHWFKWELFEGPIEYKINHDSFSPIPNAIIAIFASSEYHFNDGLENKYLAYAGDCPNSDPDCNPSTQSEISDNLVYFDANGTCGAQIVPRFYSWICDCYLRWTITICGNQPHSTGLPTSTSEDLWQTLTHEFGHALDLDHNWDTQNLNVMGSVFGGDQIWGSLGNTKWRHLYRYDINELINIYGIRNNSYLYQSRSNDDTTWTSPSIIDNQNPTPNRPGVAAGWTLNNSWYQMASWISSLPTYYGVKVFDIADPSNTKKDLGYESRQGPGGGYHIPTKQTLVGWKTIQSETSTSNLHSITFATSKDKFNTYYYNPYIVRFKDDAGNYHTVKSYYPPSLAYDFYSKRVYLVWTNRSPDCPRRDASDPDCEKVRMSGTDYVIYDNQILITSSSNGSQNSWGKLILYNYNETSVNAPAMACEDSSRAKNCIICVPGTDSGFKIWCFSIGFYSDGSLYGKGPSINTPYNDNPVMPLGIAWGGVGGPQQQGLFVINWKSNSGTIGPYKNIWFYNLYLTGTGDITWNYRNKLTTHNTLQGPV